MDKIEHIPLPPVLPALAEDLDPCPRRPRRDGLSWITRMPSPEHVEPAGDDPAP